MFAAPFLYPAKFAGVRRRPFLLCFLILFLPPFSVTPSRTVPSATWKGNPVKHRNSARYC